MALTGFVARCLKADDEHRGFAAGADEYRPWPKFRGIDLDMKDNLMGDDIPLADHPPVQIPGQVRKGGNACSHTGAVHNPF